MSSLKIKRLTKSALLPTRSYGDALAYDLYANKTEEVPTHMGDIIKIHTGIAIGFPKGYGGLVCDRSGMALKGYFVVAGVIDEDYTGEIMVIMRKEKWLSNPNKGDKVAQLILLPTPHFEVVETATLPETTRGKKGFGSSGK
jgi:dUTP pyrophosphatase